MLRKACSNSAWGEAGRSRGTGLAASRAGTAETEDGVGSCRETDQELEPSRSVDSGVACVC
jgi:hypothetical protein